MAKIAGLKSRGSRFRFQVRRVGYSIRKLHDGYLVRKS